MWIVWKTSFCRAMQGKTAGKEMWRTEVGCPQNRRVFHGGRVKTPSRDASPVDYILTGRDKILSKRQNHIEMNKYTLYTDACSSIQEKLSTDSTACGCFSTGVFHKAWTSGNGAVQGRNSTGKKSARRKMRSYPQTVQQLWITQTVRCSIWSKRFYAAPEEEKRRRECAGLMKMRCLDDSLGK